jgi:hypothetical protein
MSPAITKKLKRPQQHYDMVEVWWDDAAGLRHGWMARTEPVKPQMVVSVGFLIIDNPDHIIIAQDTDENGDHNGRTQIPWGMVKKIKVLRKKDKKEEEIGTGTI